MITPLLGTMFQHSGEEWFQIPWQGYAALLVILVTYLLLSFMNKLPSMDSFRNFADTINSAGGHILLLSLFTLLSIKIAMQFFYHVLGLPGDTITKAEATISVGMAFVQGTLAGTFIGALLKTMSGGKANGNLPADKPDTLTPTFTPENGAKK